MVIFRVKVAQSAVASLTSPQRSSAFRPAPEKGPNSRQVTPLESSASLLSPLELTLTKYKDLKSHRIILLQKRVGEGMTLTPVAKQRHQIRETAVTSIILALRSATTRSEFLALYPIRVETGKPDEPKPR
jgi:hypothetical protein